MGAFLVADTTSFTKMKLSAYSTVSPSICTVFAYNAGDTTAVKLAFTSTIQGGSQTVSIADYQFIVGYIYANDVYFYLT